MDAVWEEAHLVAGVRAGSFNWALLAEVRRRRRRVVMVSEQVNMETADQPDP